MIRKLVIANRGEIAVRIARTAHRMGIATVAVHSAVDAGALHVEVCDEAVALSADQPQGGYLDQAAILEAARITGADAVHPGYGFLSENPDFAAAVEAAGLIFVGPTAEAIRAMGLKDAAKALMEEAGVPVVPGYHGADQAPDRLAQEAARIGYPVLIKAVAGGGGKGMRRVEGAEEFEEALASAQAEARGAFGNADVLIEKYVLNPRHIEVQVFGDGTRAIHLHERDCSLQRRHQKVIEEAPAPGMSPEMRAAMGAAAVRAAEAIGYRGAGTVEFIVDASSGLRPDGFYFMEMNTRLQVEHPVTEAVTGLDLVELQLRIAAGEALPLSQEDVPLRGHTVEARLYAEDVPAGFLPATGRLAVFEPPEGARVDSGVRAGDVISPHYDPMIAKVIVWAETRAAAFAGLSRALRQTRIAGVVTNLGFLDRLITHPEVLAGDVETGLIDRAGAALTDDPAPSEAAWAQAAVAGLGLDRGAGGFTLWAPLRWQVTLSHRGEARTLWVTVGRDGAEVDGIAVTWAQGWRVGGRRLSAPVVSGGQVTTFLAGPQVFAVADPLDRASRAAASDVIEAPMPGLVRAVLVAPGAEVAEGDRLAVLEAMKMEHTLRAPRAGLVAEVPVAEGAQVEAGALLIRFEAEIDDGDSDD
ncbi:MAG: acetyl/propionyl/methylcrotonyl-CoA carboxylase subunit alpha [Shimia sp.]